MTLDGIPQLIDRLATRYAEAPDPGAIQAARQEFDGLRGTVYDDDELHQTHMALFLEWYVLERPCLEQMSPAEHALFRAPNKDDDRDLLVALVQGQRSLFELVKELPNALQIHDLVLGGRWQVESAAPLAGLEPGDIFEARLLPWEGGVRFGPIFCFHPRPARAAIHALLDQAAEKGTLDLLLISTLAEMRLRYSRYRNIAVEHIYTEAPFSTREVHP